MSEWFNLSDNEVREVATRIQHWSRSMFNRFLLQHHVTKIESMGIISELNPGWSLTMKKEAISYWLAEHPRFWSSSPDETIYLLQKYYSKNNTR